MRPLFFLVALRWGPNKGVRPVEAFSAFLSTGSSMTGADLLPVGSMFQGDSIVSKHLLNICRRFPLKTEDHGSHTD